MIKCDKNQLENDNWLIYEKFTVKFYKNQLEKFYCKVIYCSVFGDSFNNITETMDTSWKRTEKYQFLKGIRSSLNIYIFIPPKIYLIFFIFYSKLEGRRDTYDGVEIRTWD